MKTAEVWVWLSEAMPKGSPKARALISCFGSAGKIFEATGDELRKCEVKLTDGEILSLTDKSLEKAKKIISDCERKGIRIITMESEEYPRCLLEIHESPVLLYAKGKPLLLDEEVAIAIVGTRNASAEGQNAARKFGEEIAECGGIVVSGLARGIDTLALSGALAAGGRTVAVLGSGVDVCYPPENKRIMEEIEKNGTVISEYPPKSPPDRYNFPKRNRIVSAISLGTVVVEAPLKSGALITAKHALSQNRDVFAVPSGIFKKSAEGSNRLIREGAIPVMSGRDVLSEYEALFPQKINLKPGERKKVEERIEKLSEEILKGLSDDERKILESVSGGALRSDEIAGKCEVPVARILSILTLLEIKGKIKRLPGDRFEINIK